MSSKRDRKIEKRINNAIQRRIDDYHRREKVRMKSTQMVTRAHEKIEWILDWNCVFFKRGSVVIYSRSDMNIKFKPTQVVVPKSIEAFNYLKKYLNERLPPIRCSILGQNLKVVDMIDFSKAILQFDTAARQGVIKVSRSKTSNTISPLPISFKQALLKAQQITPEEFKKYKSEYIDFLVNMQSKEYKIIPCLERLTHTTGDMSEYAFMFSLDCGNGNIMIVHENVNPDRSTLIFEVKKESFNKSIRSIYDFLQGAEINKRSNLRLRNVEMKEANVIRYRSINHDNFYQWNRIMRSCVLYDWAMNVY